MRPETDARSRALAKAIKVNPILKTLNLEDNKMGQSEKQFESLSARGLELIL